MQQKIAALRIGPMPSHLRRRNRTVENVEHLLIICGLIDFNGEVPALE